MLHHHHSHCEHHSTSCIHQAENPVNKVRLLLVPLFLIGSFSGVELAASFFTHSLALKADFGHLLADTLAVGVAVLAAIASRLTKTNSTRLEVTAALINGISLAAIALWVGKEAIERWHSPPVEILSLPMLATAIAGLIVNGINMLVLHKDSHDDLNIKGVFLHVVADALSSISLIVAAIAVYIFHWLWMDWAIAFFVAGLILLSAIPLIVQSSSALLSHTLIQERSH